MNIVRLLFCLILATTGFANAQTTIVFVNGIQVTRKAAKDAATGLVQKLNDSTNRTGSSKRSFDWDYVWNPKGWYEDQSIRLVCGSLCQDNYELLVLKADEEAYAKHFRNILAPHIDASPVNESAAAEVAKFANSLLLGQNSAVASGFINSANTADTLKAIDLLSAKMRAPGQRVIVAHSQGNLLANLAWAKSITSLGGSEAPRRMRLVNVANASRFAVSNLNLTHDGDRVLYDTLVNLAEPYGFTRTTPDCEGAECKFALASPTFAAPESYPCIVTPDGLCSHFFDTYTSNKKIPTSLVDQRVAFLSGTEGFIDRLEDLVYAAAASLDVATPPSPTVLDQRNDQYMYTSYGMGLSAHWQQGVTVGVTGKLSAIELFFVDTSQFFPGLSPGAVEVSVDRGFPWVSSPTIVATIIALPGVNRVDLSGLNLRFNQGDQFTLGLRGVGDASRYYWNDFQGTQYFNPANVADPYYPRGFLYGGGGPLRSDFGFDMGFRTYVEPSVDTSGPTVSPVSLPLVYQGITFNHAFRFVSASDGVVHTCYFATNGSQPQQSGITYPSPYIGIESNAMYSPDESCGGTYLTPNTRLLNFYSSPPRCSDGTCGPAIACPLAAATWSSFRAVVPSWWEWLGTNICGQIYFPGDVLYSGSGPGGSQYSARPERAKGSDESTTASRQRRFASHR